MSVRPVGSGFSPLDEQLALNGSGGRYSTRVLGWLVRLGAELPFARAAFWLSELTGVSVSVSTVRRQTEAVGATAVARAEAEVARLEREMPTPAVRAERLVLGVDGAMAPLVGSEWGEVKLVSVGVPVPASQADRCPPHPQSHAQPRLQQVTYFARLSDAETFGQQALGELSRRGVETATAVAAVQDGAPWLQGFVDLHRPDALRILDWPHAAEHLTALSEQLFGAHSPRAQRVAERLRRWLWEEGPERVLAILAGWQRARPDLATAVAYFRERREQLDYPTFRQHGWPVGSGTTESGHKQVMQARMKRAGMRWARSHVNPMLALSLLDHNARWDSDGSTLFQQHRSQSLNERRQRQQTRRQARQAPAPAPVPLAAPSIPASTTPTLPTLPARRLNDPACHPWRRYGAPLAVKI